MLHLPQLVLYQIGPLMTAHVGNSQRITGELAQHISPGQTKQVIYYILSHSGLLY